MQTPALVVIDVQNDYFPGGAFPLWAPEAALEATVRAIGLARSRGMPVVLVQHVADAARGPARFFNPGSPGAEIHPAVREAAGDAPVVVKHFTDAFERTDLHATLQGLGVDALLLCGMMSHNCVTHTALARAADAYRSVTVLRDASTTVSEVLHAIAMSALAPRVALATVEEALA